MPPEAFGPRSMAIGESELRKVARALAPEIANFSRKVFHNDALPEVHAVTCSLLRDPSGS